jgi:hypothetical protein
VLTASARTLPALINSSDTVVVPNSS